MNKPFNGPLKVHPKNSRYFTDNSGKAIYLTGSHTWENLQDIKSPGSRIFNYDAYIDFMQKYNHNFMRMWIWEQAAWMPGSEDKCMIEPLPYSRTGPGIAIDGMPKFNLDIWNDVFFERLRERVMMAGEKGIYVSIMMFQGWSIKKSWLPGDPWKGHPFHAENNINNVNGDLDGDGTADIHCMDIPEVVAYEEAYIRKVVDTVNDLDNVLYEIINEAPGEERTIYWQLDLAEYFHRYESTKPKQHPVGTTPSGNCLEKDLFPAGTADWISPSYTFIPSLLSNPPAATGDKVILHDTDHVEDQLIVTYHWVWKCLTRGLHPIFMDPYDSKDFCGRSCTTPAFIHRLELIHRNMGYSLKMADRMNLAAMVPCNALSSTGYCLTNPGVEYLVFLPEGGTASVMLAETDGAYSVEWLNPITGATTAGEEMTGGRQHFDVPFVGSAVLYIYK